MVRIFALKLSSNANEVGDQAIATSAHTAHDDHILWSCKVSIPAAMFNDTQCNDAADPGQTFEFGSIGEVDIEPFRSRCPVALDRHVIEGRMAQAKQKRKTCDRS